MIKID